MFLPNYLYLHKRTGAVVLVDNNGIANYITTLTALDAHSQKHDVLPFNIILHQKNINEYVLDGELSIHDFLKVGNLSSMTDSIFKTYQESFYD